MALYQVEIAYDEEELGFEVSASIREQEVYRTWKRGTTSGDLTTALKFAQEWLQTSEPGNGT